MPAAALVALQPRHKQRQRPTCWHQVSHLHISESVDLSSVVNIQSIVIIAIFFSLSLSLSLSIMPVDLMNKKKTIDLYLYLRKKRYEVTWNGLLLKIYFHYYLDENARVGIFEIWTLLKKFRATFWCICSIYFVNFPPKISDLLIDLLLEPAANYLHLKPRLRAATMANWFHQMPITSNAGSQSIIFLNWNDVVFFFLFFWKKNFVEEILSFIFHLGRTLWNHFQQPIRPLLITSVWEWHN